MKEMKILNATIPLSDDYLPIHKLRFLNDNPRVYACTHGEPDFESLTDGEQQERIYKKLLEEPSVKNLIPDIKRHGGLMEPILVRHDTYEVIEGNSRLAVYKKLHDRRVKGEWELIPCDIVSSLTDEQLAAFLHQVHVKGKTQWSAYEKANFAYARHTKKRWTLDRIAEIFGESPGTIRTRIKVIELMMENNDNERSRFNYYNVLVRNLANEMKADSSLRDFLLDEIKESVPKNGSKFTAQELRDKLPVIIKKPKVLKKYINKEIDLDQGYQRAKISDVQQKVKNATGLISDISINEIFALETNEFNAFKQEIRKLSREMKRVEGMIKNHKS